ncbi:MAG: MFS transporter [Chloroflexota bacterium]|nr:MAG: MFS transporter [Chloroflexota bacterium]
MPTPSCPTSRPQASGRSRSSATRSPRVPRSATTRTPEPSATSPDPAAGTVIGRFPALASPIYRRLLLGNTLATLGAFMQATAQGWLVLQLTNSPGLLGLIGAISGLPTLFLAVLAGVLADRLDRRRLLAWSYGAAALLSAILAVLTFTEAVAYWHVAVIALAGGVLLTIQMPASQAIVSTAVDRAVLGGAIALNSAQYNLMRIVGPSLAGLAIAAGGLAFGFVANAVALVVVAVIFIRLPLPPTRALGRLQAALWGDLRDGVRHVAADRVLSTLVLLAAAPALFILNYLVFLPVYARDILAIGAPGLGLLTSSIGIGALTGALLVASRRPQGGSGKLALVGLASMSISLATFAVSTSVPLSCVALAILGASQVAYYSTTNTLLQVRVPGRLRGRVHSLYVLFSIGLIPLGNVVAGALAERVTVPPVLAVGGAATLAIVVVAAIVRPEIRHLQPGLPGTSGASGAAPAAADPAAIEPSAVAPAGLATGDVTEPPLEA